MGSALRYVEETLLNAEIVKLLPRCFAPVVGGVLSRCLSSHKTFFKSLIPATEQRIREHELRKKGHEVPKRVSTLQQRIYHNSRVLANTFCDDYRLIVSNGSSKQHPSKTLGRRSASSMS